MSLDINLTNDIFAKNAWYFGSAMVRANYNNLLNRMMYIRGLAAEPDIGGKKPDIEDKLPDIRETMKGIIGLIRLSLQLNNEYHFHSPDHISQPL